jgi:hypothetical protein
MSSSVGSFSVSAVGTGGFTSGSAFANVVPGLGIPLFINNNPINGPSLGGGIKGRMPQTVLDHDNSDSFARTRFTLVNGFNTSRTTGSSYPRRIITPFRAINNAGDLLARQNYSCGGSCQTPQSRPGLYGLSNAFGSTSTSCQADIFWSPIQMNPKVPSGTCNGKYVYDGSDYTRFKKNVAMNQNFNDISFGGNTYNGSQSAYRAARIY